jgi:hypothetical protein
MNEGKFSNRRRSRVKTIVFLAVATWTVALFISVVSLSTYFAYFRPQAPEPQLGRVYSYRYHRTTVYLTKREYCLVGPDINVIGFCSLALTMALAVVWQRDLPKLGRR